MEVNSMEDETGRIKEEHNNGCVELEERVLKAEEKCIELETELEKRKKESELLKTRVKELESEKLGMEEELRNLKESEEYSLIIEQKMKNNALEIKKQLTENESKNEDGLSIKGLAYHQIPGSPYISTPDDSDYILCRKRDIEPSRRRVNKMLSSEDDCHKSTEVVDLCEDKTEERSEKESADAMDTLEERSSGEIYEDEDVEATSTCLFGRKRKQVITSDSENDDADNIPISKLKKIKPPNQEMQDLVDTLTTEENTSGRVGTQRRVSSRLKKQRESKEISASSERNTTERLVGISTTGNAEDDETDEELESEGESLDGFIVDDDIHDTASEKSDEILEEESDVEAIYADVMSTLRREKKRKKRRWEYEADMLADFGKDPELCMKAVCVMYRFQTEDEKMTWSSNVSNGRGFSQVDAIRGTRIGKFLTDGNPHGDLKKSVEELESFEFDGVEICKDLANKYSKQLFQIYKNREDPFFTLPLSP